jgi:hypothetical protein
MPDWAKEMAQKAFNEMDFDAFSSKRVASWIEEMKALLSC